MISQSVKKLQRIMEVTIDYLTRELAEYPVSTQPTETTAQRIAMHHIYEYEKGIRCMVLCTLEKEEIGLVTSKLNRRGIAYFTQATPKKSKVNLFFGRDTCVETVRYFLRDKYLHELSAEQDFILGTLLGYDVCGQCERYRKRLALVTAE